MQVFTPCAVSIVHSCQQTGLYASELCYSKDTCQRADPLLSYRLAWSFLHRRDIEGWLLSQLTHAMCLGWRTSYKRQSLKRNSGFRKKILWLILAWWRLFEESGDDVECNLDCQGFLRMFSLCTVMNAISSAVTEGTLRQAAWHGQNETPTTGIHLLTSHRPGVHTGNWLIVHH